MAKKSESQRQLLRRCSKHEEDEQLATQQNLVQTTSYRNRKGKNRKFRKITAMTATK